jgi:hypothetical protein
MGVGLGKKIFERFHVSFMPSMVSGMCGR